MSQRALPCAVLLAASDSGGSIICMGELFISYSCKLSIFNIPFPFLIPLYSSSWLPTGSSHRKLTQRRLHSASYKCWQLSWTKNVSSLKLLLPQYLSPEIWFPFSYCRCKERNELGGGISHSLSCRERHALTGLFCPRSTQERASTTALIDWMLLEFSRQQNGSAIMPLVIIHHKWQPGQISNSGSTWAEIYMHIIRWSVPCVWK